MPSYAEAVADKSPSETEQQRYVFFARDGHTIVYRLAQWTDPFTAPQTRTGCVLWANFMYTRLDRPNSALTTGTSSKRWRLS